MIRIIADHIFRDLGILGFRVNIYWGGGCEVSSSSQSSGKAGETDSELGAEWSNLMKSALAISWIFDL